VTGMAAVAIDVVPAADPGLGGPVPARTTGPSGEDRSPVTARQDRTVRSWPLLVLAAPATAEVWSGWVGIAQKTGFGLVRPYAEEFGSKLPGASSSACSQNPSEKSQERASRQQTGGGPGRLRLVCHHVGARSAGSVAGLILRARGACPFE
jgi:hypothetical protein